jgi:PGF-pre-PGF domain-containing protein
MSRRACGRLQWAAVTAFFIVALLLFSAAPLADAQLRKATQLSLSPGTFTVASGQSITLAAKLTSDGQPLAGKRIAFAATVGSVSPSVATTDENGVASANYTAPVVSVRTSVTITAAFLGDLEYEGSSAACQGTIEAGLPAVSISGASFAVPETLKGEVSSYRKAIPEDVLKLLPMEVPSESFILATPKDLYLVFASQSDKGLAHVEGWRLPRSISLRGVNLTVVVAKSAAFEKEGVPATVSEILASPDKYAFKLVKVSANRRQASILYDPDKQRQPHVMLPITVGYLAEKPVKPLAVVRAMLERARELTLELDERLIKSLLEAGEEERLWLFNFEYEYWYDVPAVTNGIVLPANHSVFRLVEQSMPMIGRLARLEGRVVLYEVKTDIPYVEVSSVGELKANGSRYLGKTVKITANCCGGRISVKETLRKYAKKDIPVDVRLEGLAAWSEASVPPKREELLMVAGISSFNQTEPFVKVTGVFELIGKVVSAKQVSESMPEDVSLVICREPKKVKEINFEGLAQQFKDKVRESVGELYWTLQDIYPYRERPDIPFKVPGKVFRPKAPIFVRSPRELPEIFVERNFTVNIAVAAPEEPVRLNITNSHVSSISIALKEIAKNVTIYFEKLVERPREVLRPPGLVYAYHEISVSVSKEALKGANITFWVSKEWLTANSATAEDVAMLRYYAGEWTKLLTRVVGGNATHFKFTAETPGFSIFAIAVKAVAVTTGVEGYVKNEVGRPIKGVSVVVLSKVALVGKVSETTTDEMGHYFVELPPGDYVLVFSATSYADKSADVSLRLGELKRVDATLKQAKAEFSENWGGTKFEIALVTKEPWKVGSEVSVEVWITVSDMGGNKRVEFKQLKLSLSRVEKVVPLNIGTDVGGTVYNGNVSIRVLDGFEFMKPESEDSCSLWLSLDGSFIDKWDIAWPGLTMKSTSVRVYAPPSPVSLSAELPEKVLVGDECEVKVKVKNNGEYPIRNVKVSLLQPIGTSVIGLRDWSKNTMSPGEEALVTFKLKADLVTTTTIDVSFSYETLWGYLVSELAKTLGSVTIIKIPTSISVSATPTKVTVGEKVIVKGSIRDAKGLALSVPLTLTIVEPDGVTRTLHGTSAPNGTFGFEVALSKKGRHSFVVSFGGDLTHEASKGEEIYVEAEEKKMCIIATAAYGSELDPHVQFLRSFRDNFALKTFAGSKFMEAFNAWYYSFSPSVASFISTSEALRATTRAAIYPLIGVLRLGVLTSDVFSFNGEVSVIVAGLVISALIGLIYFTPPALLVLYVVGRWRSVSEISRIKPRLLLIPLAVSTLLVVIAELALSPILMMIGSGALVLSMIALVTWTIAIKATTRLLTHHSSKS